MYILFGRSSGFSNVYFLHKIEGNTTVPFSIKHHFVGKPRAYKSYCNYIPDENTTVYMLLTAKITDKVAVSSITCCTYAIVCMYVFV